MREIGTYTVSEWLAFAPVVHRFKYLRNRALERFYRNLGRATRDEFLSENAQKLGHKLVVTIAFNTPWAVDLFLRAARLNLRDTSVIVADNSSNVRARVEINELCAGHGAVYIRLPSNPEWHPNRSHGIALNWVYHNLIKALEPEVFAFFDHDLFALGSLDIAEPVAHQPVYGRRRQQSGQRAWSLWAGYAIFTKSGIDGRTLDFNYDLPLRLDTGGYNWPRLYRFLDGDAMTFAKPRSVQFCDPDNGLVHPCQLFDSFVHFGSASHSPGGKDPDRIAFFQRLIAHIESGGHWEELTDTRQAPDKSGASGRNGRT